jgi:hypothetical protein
MPQHTTYGVGGFDPAKPNGNAIEQWDDDTRTYSKFTAPASTRPYTAAENTAADARAVQAATAVTRAANRATVKLIITDLQAEKDRCDVVIAKTNAAITGADTKDVARAGKRIADAAIELARFVQDS